MLKEFLSYQGNQDIYGSKDATRAAFSLGLIDEGDIWMEMIKDRNRTSYTYNRAIAKEIATHISELFFDQFITLRTKMQDMENVQ